MPGRHDGQQQVWISREVYEQLQEFISPGDQRKSLDTAIKRYCAARRRSRLVTPKAKSK